MIYSLRIEVIADTFAKAEEEVEAYERAVLRCEFIKAYGEKFAKSGTWDDMYVSMFKELIGREVTDESYHKGEGHHVVGRRKVLYKAHPDTVVERLAEIYKSDEKSRIESVNIHVNDEQSGEAAGKAFVEELNKRKIQMNRQLQ